MHALALLLLAASPTPSRLPLKTLVLYENGVGYFERRGTVPKGAEAEIPLEPGQLDDALKSLVVMSSQGVASVEFAPPLSAEAARALAGLPEREAQASLTNLCRSLTGVEVEVRHAGATVKGRVVEVAEERLGLVDKEGQPIAEPTLLVFGEAGLARVALRSIDAIRPTGSQVALAWNRAVGARALQPERERLVVRGASGAGTVAVGYTTEAPVWRTTYRLVMNKPVVGGRDEAKRSGAFGRREADQTGGLAGNPVAASAGGRDEAKRSGAFGRREADQTMQRLQGFALVHNDSDEAWDQVKVTLASGHPTSFLFPLAGPRYGRREMLTPQDGLDTAPQLATREARAHLRGEGEWEGLGVSGVGAGGGGYGSGSVGVGHFGTVGRGSGTGSGLSSVVLEDGPTPLEPAAVSEAGDLFLYSVKEPVVLGARKSALLPIIDGATKAERVTLLDAAGVVFTAVRLENTTPLTLEGGTLSVFTDGAYTGETQLDRVKPGEVRVLKHGEDLDLEVSRGTRREEGDPRRAKLVGLPGARLLELTRVDRLVHHLDFTSRTNEPRVVLVELEEQKYRVVAGGEEDIRSPGQPRYGRIDVAPKASESVELVEEGAVVERIAADTLSSQRLAALLARKLPDDVKALLTRLRAEVTRAEDANAKVAQLDAKLKQTESDLARTRENLAAVGKTTAPDAARKLGQRLLELEKSLSELRVERDASAALAAHIRRDLLADTQVSAR